MSALEKGLGVAVLPSQPELSGRLAAASVAAAAPPLLLQSSHSTPPPPMPLGTNTKFVSARSSVWRYGARVERYELQRVVARELLPKERIRVCMLCASPGDAGVRLRYSPARRTAHLAGLVVCGSVWICPVCAARVSERRRGEVARARDWVEGRGQALVLMTFTLSHHKDSLQAALQALNGAFRRMMQRRDYRLVKAAYGLSHAIKAVEVTYGAENGWHPHLHVLQVVPVGVDAGRLQAALTALWRPALSRHRRYNGEKFTASTARGVRVQKSWATVGDYISKIGRSWQPEDELTKANSKRGREDRFTPFDLVRSVRDTSDQAHAALFREYAAAMKGTHQLRWSPGFKRLVGIVDRTDAELAADPLDDDQLAWTLHLLSDQDWAAVRYFNQRAELETVGDSGDRQAVIAFLEELRSRYFAVAWGF